MLPTMAYVARRPKGRYEIRESVHTPKGPRARSLATFTELDEATLAKARAKATTPFDDDAVRDSARRAGARLRGSSADEAARRLLLELRSGRRMTPGLQALVLDALRESPSP